LSSIEATCECPRCGYDSSAIVINIEADKGRADHVVSCSKCGYGEKMSFDAVDGEVTQREDARTYVNN